MREFSNSRVKNGRAMWMYEGRGSRGKTVEPRIGLACSGNSKEWSELGECGRGQA